MNAIQRYELIRPILKCEKTPKQISVEANVPLSTIYYYLKRSEKAEGLSKASMTGLMLSITTPKG